MEVNIGSLKIHINFVTITFNKRREQMDKLIFKTPSFDVMEDVKKRFGV